MTDTYAQDGVNVIAGDDFSAFAARECGKTSSPFVMVHDWGRGHFRGPRTFTFANLPDDVQFDVAADGAGTKPIVTVEAYRPRQAARDVLAMTCADITRWGGKPLLFSNVLDVSKLGEEGSMEDRFFRDAIRGLVDACRDLGIVAYRGETAELGPCVGSENPMALVSYNWAGFAIGAYTPSKMITGEYIEPGDVVMALKESTFRSNGISSVRAALREKFGGTDGNWWNEPEAKWAIAAASQPSTLYDLFLSRINGWGESSVTEPMIRLKGLAHISGGGIPGKFAKDILFPLGLSADLTDLWDPPDIMRKCATWRRMSDRQIYKTWHGGQAVLAVVSPHDEDYFAEMATGFGHRAKRCGVIRRGRGSPELILISRFSGGAIPFTPKDKDI